MLGFLVEGLGFRDTQKKVGYCIQNGDSGIATETTFSGLEVGHTHDLACSGFAQGRQTCNPNQALLQRPSFLPRTRRIYVAIWCIYLTVRERERDITTFTYQHTYVCICMCMYTYICTYLYVYVYVDGCFVVYVSIVLSGYHVMTLRPIFVLYWYLSHLCNCQLRLDSRPQAWPWAYCSRRALA